MFEADFQMSKMAKSFLDVIVEASRSENIRKIRLDGQTFIELPVYGMTNGRSLTIQDDPVLYRFYKAGLIRADGFTPETSSRFWFLLPCDNMKVTLRLKEIYERGFEDG